MPTRMRVVHRKGNWRLVEMDNGFTYYQTEFRDNQGLWFTPDHFHECSKCGECLGCLAKQIYHRPPPVIAQFCALGGEHEYERNPT